MNVGTLRTHLINGGGLRQNGNQYLFTVPPTPDTQYTDAQLDDYRHELPRQFLNFAPQRLRLRARFSYAAITGTAGFGFWNHPISRTGALLAPPANIWFFYSSPESDLQVSQRSPAHGFKASVLNSGQYPQSLVRMLSRPLNWLLASPRLSRLVMSIARTAVNVVETPLHLDMTHWHTYEIDWRVHSAILRVDDHVVLKTSHPPSMPLGFAAWIDNYRATASSDTGYGFAYVPVLQEQWMEIEIMDQHD